MNFAVNLLPPRLKRYATSFMGPAAMSALLVASGGAAIWLFMQVASNSVVRLFSNYFMSRLLEPEAFGLIGIAFALQSMISLMTDIGLGGSVVRSDRGADPTFLKTIWVTKIFRGLIMYAVLLGAAAWLYYNQTTFPEGSIWRMEIVPAYLCVSGLSLLINGFTSPSMLLANRDLDYRRLTILNVVTSILQVPIMIVAAMAGLGPWSLLLGALASTLASTVASHIYLRGPRMGFTWDRDCFNEIFGFGKWLLIASVCAYLLKQGDKLILATLFESRLFSLYIIAGLWLGVFINLLRMLTRKICLPVVAKCRRENPGQLPRIYKRFRLIADLLTIGAFLTLVLGADPLFMWFYEADFEPAKEFVPYAAFMLLLSPYIVTQQLMIAAGDSRSYAGIQTMAAIIMFITVPWTHAQFGPYWAAFAFAVVPLLTVPFTLWAANRVMKLNLFAELRILIFGGFALAGLIMFG